MKLEILKENLGEAAQVVARISNKNLSLPVLSCAVFVATPERASLRGTNLDLSVEMHLKAKVLKEGSVAVPASVLSQLISASTDQKIILEATGNTLTLVGSHGVSHLKTLDPSEFPRLPLVKEGEGNTLTLSTKELSRCLKAVSFATAVSGVRPELSSVFLKASGGMLTSAATDSFRLAEMKIPIKSKEVAEPVLIPARNVPEIVRVIGNGDTTEVRATENQMTFVSGGSFVTSRIIDGTFPEYNAIIPTSFETVCTTLTGDATRTLRKVSVFTDTTGQVELAVTSKDKKFTVRASNASVGETNEEIDAAVEGGENNLFFNIRYILDALSVVGADSVTFKFSGQGKPLVISEVPDKGFTYLVMPMNR